MISGIIPLFLHKNVCCLYTLEAPHQGTFNEYPYHKCTIYIMEILRKLFKNYHQILLTNNSSECFSSILLSEVW